MIVILGGMLTLPVTDEQATLVEGGEVSTEALGILLPKSWVRDHIDGSTHLVTEVPSFK
jgi:hypothetical protein